MAKKEKQERKEDLNPRTDDVEERVKRMMDPTIPDEPELPTVAKATAKAATKSQPVTIQSVSTPTAAAPSAPELPTKPATKAKVEAKPDTAIKGRKVIIPISHDGKIAAKAEATPSAPPVKKIAITEHQGGTEEIAEKLDATIAELGGTTQTAKAAKSTPEPPMPFPENKPKTAAVPQIESETTVQDAIDEAALADSPAVSSAETDKAVDEIVAAEGDELLEVEDAIRDTDDPVSEEDQPKRGIGQKLKDWWAKPRNKKIALATSALIVLFSLAVPHSRYFILNSVGIRASSSVVVLDQSTQQPLKNVKVSIGPVSAKTDESGRARLEKIKLGNSKLTIQKVAFASIEKNVTVGLGSNPLGDFPLTPTGSQYDFTVTDFLSGQPITKAEASSGEASAFSDEKGKIKLTVDKTDEADFTVKISGDGYRTEEVSIDPDSQEAKAIKLVPARKQAFVTKRSGKFDIYSVYADGKDETLVLAGSGHEREDMVLVPHSRDNVVAYVSTRPGQQNSDGFLLSNLIVINLEDNSTTNVASSERIQIIDWSSDRLVYVQVAAGASGNSPKRYRLMSYDYKEDESKELASSNYFNDVIAAGGAIYYAPSSAYQSGKTGFYKINPDGSNFQTVFDQEVWNIFRTSYDQLTLAVEQQWYSYKLGDKTPTKLAGAPANQVSRVYIGSPNTKNSIWIDVRDGKGVLLSYNLESQKDATVKSQSGLTYPVRWLNYSSVVYRVITDQETADYAVSINGGEPVKIRDVTNSGGIDRWYYY